MLSQEARLQTWQTLPSYFKEGQYRYFLSALGMQGSRVSERFKREPRR